MLPQQHKKMLDSTCTVIVYACILSYNYDYELNSVFVNIKSVPFILKVGNSGGPLINLVSHSGFLHKFRDTCSSVGEEFLAPMHSHWWVQS